MTRNLKALVLALFAVFALSAAMASGASADEFTSSSANKNTDLTGETEAGVLPTFTRGGIPVTCEKATYSGTQKGTPVTEVTVHPIYENDCTVNKKAATVKTEGCDYILSGTTEKNAKGETDATVSIECTAGKEITIEVPALGVKIHVPKQGPLLGVHYTTIPTGASKDGEVTVTATVENITSTCTPSALLCAFAGGLHNATASYTDQVLVKGFENNLGFTQNATTHEWSGTHGPQVDIGVTTS